MNGKVVGLQPQRFRFNSGLDLKWDGRKAGKVLRNNPQPPSRLSAKGCVVSKGAKHHPILITRVHCKRWHAAWWLTTKGKQVSIQLVAFGERTDRKLDLGLYPDNTPVVNLEKAWNKAGGKFKAIVIRPRSMQEFFTGMMIVDTVRERGGSVDHLILPYIPGARQDRQKWEGDWLETLKYVGKIINYMGFKSVMVADPHSPMAGMAINRMKVYNPHLLYNTFSGKGYDYVVSPDAGASDRAAQLAKWISVEVITASKHRDPATNKLSGFSIPEYPILDGKRVLLVDDICDAGGTFLGLAEILRARGATADLFVTHGLFSRGTDHLARAFRTLYATDSLDYPIEKVTYIPIVNGMIDQCA